MYNEAPLSDFTYPIFSRILMFYGGLFIGIMSVLTGELIMGATYFYVLGIIAMIAATSFSTAWHLMEIQNEYGSEKKMDSAYHNHVRCRNASIILFCFSSIMAFLLV